MYESYEYCWDGGNIQVTVTNLTTGLYDFYLYGHTLNDDDNSIFQLWSGDRDYDLKGTSIWGSGPSQTNWSEGQQFVVYRDVVVVSNQPVTIVVGHNTAY